MKQTIQSLKGTRDFYPYEMAVRNWLYENIRKVSESFGYQEWEGPFLESIEVGVGMRVMARVLWDYCLRHRTG